MVADLMSGESRFARNARVPQHVDATLEKGGPGIVFAEQFQDLERTGTGAVVKSNRDCSAVRIAPPDRWPEHLGGPAADRPGHRGNTHHTGQKRRGAHTNHRLYLGVTPRNFAHTASHVASS